MSSACSSMGASPRLRHHGRRWLDGLAHVASTTLSLSLIPRPRLPGGGSNSSPCIPIPSSVLSKMPAPPMDVFGIVYIIENAQQFWSGTDPRSLTCHRPRHKQCTELEEILHIPDDITLTKLDSTLRRYISFCAAYHGECLGMSYGVVFQSYPAIQNSTFRALCN